MCEPMCEVKKKLQCLVMLAEQCDCLSDKERILEYMSHCEGIVWEEVCTDLLDKENGLIEFNERQAFFTKNQ